MAIDSSLNQLDRAVGKAKGAILAALDPAANPKPMSVKSATSQSSPGAGDPARSFCAPWLQLIAPPSIEALRQAQERRQLMPGLAYAAQGGPIGEAINVQLKLPISLKHSTFSVMRRLLVLLHTLRQQLKMAKQRLQSRP